MNILILTGKFGMGHWSASQSLRQQLLRSFPDAKAEVVDFLTYAAPNAAEIMYRGFHLVVAHGGCLFNIYYKLTSMGHADARPPFEWLFLNKLTELLYERRPDVVIATHPLCAQLVSRLKGQAGLDLPLITCITDVSSHPEWINRNTDCYMVPSGEVRRELEARGVDPALVCVTGIPVREEFLRLKRVSEERQRAGRGSGEGRELTGCRRRELLIMGGGLGLLPRSWDFYDALNRLPDTRSTIITGRNGRMYQRLHDRWENIRVIGYTERVWEYMAEADLIVTKPGGITLFETIFAQVPILAWSPELQQEKGNARWLMAKGIGWVADKKNCVYEIQEILRDGRRLSDARLRMRRLSEQMGMEGLEGVMEAIAQNEGVAI